MWCDVECMWSGVRGVHVEWCVKCECGVTWSACGMVCECGVTWNACGVVCEV